MWSAAFSASMMVGALRLPVVIEGIIEESTRCRPSSPIARVDGSTTARGVGRIAYAAGAAGVVGALHVPTHEGVDRLVAGHVGARLDLPATVGREGRLREDLAGQPHAGPHLD